MDHMKKFEEVKQKARAKGKGIKDGIKSVAQTAALQDMMGALDGQSAKKLKGVKKVTVASNSKAGVQEGLDIAKKVLKEGEKEVTGPENETLEEQLAESPEYDDRETNAALVDSPERHVMAEDRARRNMADEMKEAGEEALEGEEHEESEAASLSSLMDEIKNLKAEIASLRAPKSFY